MLWFHQHQWRLQGASEMVFTTFRSNGAQVGGTSPITELLEVCACGASRTRTLAGHWTMEQLTPNKDAPLTDDDFLKKLKVKV